MNKNKVILLVICFIAFYQVKCQTKDSVSLSSNIRFFYSQKNEYALLKLSYKNTANDTIFLWMQNWKINYLNNEDIGISKKCPYSLNNKRLNMITLFDNFGSLKTRWFSETAYSDTLIKCNFIKKLLPGEVFFVNVTFTNKSFVTYLKKIKPKYVLCHYSYTYDGNLLLDSDKSIFYPYNDLFINYPFNPDNVDCMPFNIVTSEGINKEGNFYKIPTHRFSTKRFGISILYE